MGLSRTISEINGDFSRKSQKFSHPEFFGPTLQGFHVELVPALGDKTYNDGATGWRKKFDDIFRRLDTIHQRDRHRERQTDGRTDGRTDTGRQQRPRSRMRRAVKKT